MRIPRTRVLLPLLMMSALLAGCSTVTRKESGRPFSKKSVQELAVGSPVSAAVHLLGKPKDKTVGEQGVTIWRWEHIKSTRRVVTFLFFDMHDSQDTRKSYAYASVKNGRIVKTWTDWQ